MTDDQLSHNVVVCIHNGFDDVTRCLNALERHWQSEGLASLILVDDCSDDRTASHVRKFTERFERAVLIRLDEQHFYTRAANIGLGFSNTPLTTLLNSDTIVTAGWARKIRQVFAHNPNIGIVGPLSNAASTQSVPLIKSSDGQTAINHLPKGVSPEDFAAAIAGFARGHTTPYVPLVHGFCYTIHRKVIEAIGYFDEQAFPTGYGEENDYSFRCEDAGFVLGIALDSFVYHAKTGSYQPEQQRAFSLAGQQALGEKYSTHRIGNAVAMMEAQPQLAAIRAMVKKSWPAHHWASPDPDTPGETISR